MEASIETWYLDVKNNLPPENLTRRVVDKLDELVDVDIFVKARDTKDLIIGGSRTLKSISKAIVFRLEEDNKINKNSIEESILNIRMNLIKLGLPLTDISSTQVAKFIALATTDELKFKSEYINYLKTENYWEMQFNFDKFFSDIRKKSYQLGTFEHDLILMKEKMSNGGGFKVYTCPFRGGFVRAIWERMLARTELLLGEGNSKTLNDQL